MLSNRITSMLRIMAIAAFVAAIILARGDKTLLAIVTLLVIGNLLFVAVVTAESQKVSDRLLGIIEINNKTLKTLLSALKFIDQEAPSKPQSKEDV